MINISNIKISYDHLLIRLGYSKFKTQLDEKTETLIKENLELAQKLIKPNLILAFEPIRVQGGIITFKGGYEIESFDVGKLLSGCYMAYGVAVTIGGALEKKRNELLANKETFQGLVLDAAGSVAAEEAIISANAQIRKQEERAGNTTTKRYSPGYGDWELEDQPAFLAWIGASEIGITHNESFLMQPEKSVSALIGVKKI